MQAMLDTIQAMLNQGDYQGAEAVCDNAMRTVYSFPVPHGYSSRTEAWHAFRRLRQAAIDAQ